MTYQYWYYAAVVPQEDITNFKLGASVTLDFNIVGAEPVPAVISYINTDPELGNVVIFKCDYINDVYINLRVTQADVNFKNVTGLRVSSSAIRFMGAQKGVYTVLGNKLVFRPVTVIHEDQGFVLCRENDTEYSVPLEQFDEVVIEGTGLYNDKQLK